MKNRLLPQLDSSPPKALPIEPREPAQQRRPVFLRIASVEAYTSTCTSSAAWRKWGWLSYLLLAALTFFIFIAGFGIGRFLSGTPIVNSGDALHHLTLAKAIIEQGWYWNISRLSAPFTLPMVLFPVLGTFDTLLMWLLSFIFHDPAVLVTAVYALMFAIAAVSAAYVLHDLGVEKATSLAFGIVFAFAPFTFLRTPSHLPVLPHLMPFAIGFSVHLLTGNFPALGTKQRLVYYAGAVALGLNYLYAAFFSCFFVGLAMLLCLFRPGRLAVLKGGAIFIALVIAAAAVSFAPVFVAAHNDPAAAKEIIGVKSPAEADLYGLKIRHMLMPSPNSAYFTKLNQRLRDKDFPLENENTTARLGLIASLGFLALLAWGLSRLVFSASTTRSKLSCLLDPLAALTIATLLLASIGGFGSIFNVLVSTEIRAYNRISPFIAFMSLAAIACWITVSFSRFTEWLRIALLAVIVVFAVRDQSEFWMMKFLNEQSAGIARNVQPVVNQLEKELPAGALVYQMPYTPYPHTPNLFGMHSQTHLLAYVLSKDLRWSYPALSSTAIGFNRALAVKSLPAAAEDLATAGFSAIWVDRRGFEDRGQDIVNRLSAIGLPQIANAVDQSITVFSLAPIVAKLRAQFSPQVLEQRRKQTLQFPSGLHIGNTVDFSRAGNSSAVVGPGWSFQEDQFRWTEGARSEIRLPVAAMKGQPFSLVFVGDPFLFGSHSTQTIGIRLKGSEIAYFHFELGKPNPIVKVNVDGHNIDADGTLQITLSAEDLVSPKEAGMSGDERHLGLALKSVSIVAQ